MSLDPILKKPIKLWVVNYFFYPLYAGPAERFLRYSAGFRERGVDTTFVTSLQPDLKQEEVIKGNQVKRLGNPSSIPESVNLFIKRVVDLALKEKPDIILFLVISPSDVFQVLKLKMRGFKLVFTSGFSLNREKLNPIKTGINNFKLFLLHSLIDVTVSSSDALSADFKKIGLPARKLKSIVNGVDLNRFSPPSNEQEVIEFRQDLDLPQKEIIALFVGNRIDRKGVIELVQGWKMYRRNGGKGYLLLVGQELRNNPEYNSFYVIWDEVLKTIEDNDHIIMHGPSDEIEKYYRASDLFVFPSKLEGLPNSIPESMATRLPVITNRFTGFSPELGRDKKELIITECRPEKICEDIEVLMNDENLRSQLGRNARRWVEDHHSLAGSLDKYVNLFNELSG
ncbi:glycosyltransferase family 4 protein [bacterium]|nr:glycosyltransferase family 4 protein [bacterium]